MKKIIISIVVLFLSINILNAQETATAEKPLIPVVKLGDNVQVKFGGFFRADAYFDNREAVGAIDDLFSFFPENKKIDPQSGNDLNAVSRTYLSTQATRFNALFTGPDVWKAKSSSFFEYEFSGGPVTQASTGATNPIGLRLRHAWAKLAWDKSELLIGKTWNPLAEISFPSVIDLNTGIPFRPYGRGDQLRFTWKPSSTVNILAAALYQTEHKSFIFGDVANTAGAISNTNDVRANPIPDLHLQLQFKTNSLFAGLVSEYKAVRPATQNTGTLGVFNTNTTVSSSAFGAFVDYKIGKFNAKVSGLYGQNLSELFQQGGYAVKTFNATTGAKTYTPSNSTSYWANVTYGSKLTVGLFGGYTKNLGFNDNILTAANGGAFLGRWQNIDHIYRVAPSLKYSIGRLIFGAEVDYNVAAYGTVDYANKGKVIGAKEVSVLHGNFATTFLF